MLALRPTCKADTYDGQKRFHIQFKIIRDKWGQVSGILIGLGERATGCKPKPLFQNVCHLTNSVYRSFSVRCAGSQPVAKYRLHREPVLFM